MKKFLAVISAATFPVLVCSLALGAGFFEQGQAPPGGYPSSPNFVHPGTQALSFTDNADGSNTADLVRWRDAYINRNIIGGGGAISGFTIDNSLINIDNAYKFSSPHVYVRAFGAKGDGVTDDNVAIHAAFAAATDGSTIFFPKGVYPFSTTLAITADDVTIRCDGSTLKLTNNYYTTGGSYGITVTGQRFTMIGCTLDGNRANQTNSVVFLTLTDSSDSRILYNRFKNNIYHAIHASGVGTGTRNLLVEGNTFTNNYGNANNSDFYSSGNYNSGKITNNHFSRDNNTYGTVAPNISQSQALYMSGGDWDYSANSFDNIYKPFDFRVGNHRVRGAKIRDCGVAFIQGINDLYPRSWISDVDASDVQGISSGTTGAYILAGESTINNLRIEGKAGATDLWYGLRIRGSYTTGTTLQQIKIIDLYSHGASSAHVYVTGTDNGVLLERPTFKNTINAANAVSTATNTDNILIINPYLDNVSIPFVNTDGMQRITGLDSSFRTINSGTAAYDNVTSLTINHGLAVTPTSVIVTPSARVGNLWVTNIGGTSFKVNTDNAVVGASVYWRAQKD